MNFKTPVVRMNNEVFAIKQEIADSNIFFSVLMFAHREKCNRFKMTLEIQDNNSKTAFLAQFNPTPVGMESESFVDDAIFILPKKMFEKMITSDGEKLRYNLEMKVSEKRTNED